jgi:hypothetical protein
MESKRKVRVLASSTEFDLWDWRHWRNSCLKPMTSAWESVWQGDDVITRLQPRGCASCWRFATTGFRRSEFPIRGFTTQLLWRARKRRGLHVKGAHSCTITVSGIYRQISAKLPNTEFQEKPLGRSQFVIWGQTQTAWPAEDDVHFYNFHLQTRAETTLFLRRHSVITERGRDAASISETSENVHQTTLRYNPEGSHLRKLYKFQFQTLIKETLRKSNQN